jgi:hypothetical protein
MKMMVWSGILAALVTGCSSSQDLGKFSSSLDKSKTLEQLTPDEGIKLCNEVYAFETRSGMIADMIELTCRVNAPVGVHRLGDTSQSDADLRAACKENYDVCRSAPPPAPAECPFPRPTCTATVADEDAALNDWFAWTQAARAQVPTCDEITVAYLEALGGSNPEPPLPASLTTFGEKCPATP